MADSTPSEILARRNRQGEALQRAITSVDDCEVFGKALIEYNVASALVHATDADMTVLYHAATRIDRTAWNVVVSAADYHCAHVIFDVIGALDALEVQDEDDD